MTLLALVPSENFLYEQLMVLDLEGCKDLKNDDVVNLCRKMTLLRYLGLRNTNITVLPSEIKNLQKLETLDIRETELKELPKEVADLSKLTLLLVGAKGNPHCRNDCSKVFNNLPTSLEKVKAKCVSIPTSLEKLSGLTFLDITVAELKSEDIKNLGNISSLKTLLLQVLVASWKEKIGIKNGDGFTNLENFMLDSRKPWVVFEKDAMPKVKHLGFKLYAGPSGRIPSGISSLKSLEKVTLYCSSGYEASACVRDTIESIDLDAMLHRKRITLSINGKTYTGCRVLAYMENTQSAIILILLTLFVGVEQVFSFNSLRSAIMSVTQPGPIRPRLSGLFGIFWRLIVIFLLYRFFGKFCLFILISVLLFMILFIARSQYITYVSRRARS